MDLDGGVIHNEGRLKGVGPEMGTSVANAIWAPRRGPTPSNAPRNGFPHPIPYVQPNINNRYIGNFMKRRQETRQRQEISGPIQRWFIIREWGV
jgi:hypothetical protein